VNFGFSGRLKKISFTTRDSFLEIIMLPIEEITPSINGNGVLNLMASTDLKAVRI